MNTNLLERLIAAGTPVALVAEVAAELGRADADRKAIEERRAADRARKQAQRSRDVTGQHVTSEDAPAPLDGPPDENNSNPPFIPQTQIGDAPAALDFGLVAEAAKLFASAALVTAKATKAAGYHRLPATWEAPADLPDKLAAKVAQWPPGMLEDEADAFRAWAANAKDENGKGRKLDWNQAYHNWLRSKHDDWQRRQPRSRSNNRPGAGRRTIADYVADQYAQRASGLG